MKFFQGKEKRCSLNRYFHIVNKGWYAESREGHLGPYMSYGEAKDSLRHHVRNLFVGYHHNI